ncbi:hypothetical protein DVH24_022160 [Malus domestica]|uniref:Uncharacterized protein n=1 Tax=Malus domestica TaxID=3750 RepID=A0A498IX60_MALDO|nr:hypothetical protein DVH24_022160 [Malus domestica]
MVRTKLAATCRQCKPLIHEGQAWSHDIVRFEPRSRPHGFVYGNSHENFPVSHPSWECSHANSLNFGVSMEPETSELPKGLVLGRDENIHIRLTRSSLLNDVRSYNK